MQNSCCTPPEPEKQPATSSCHADRGRPDYFLWVSLTTVALLYLIKVVFLSDKQPDHWYVILSTSVFSLMNTVWWGILLGVLMVAILAKIPREFVISILGTNCGLRGILRATAAGVLLDLCSHGILMVGAKLYERGASTGQVMAFLIASPWNSFSLTLILIALIGIGWTLAFIALSMLIAIIVGVLFEYLTAKGILSPNPQQVDLPEGFNFLHEAKHGLSQLQFNKAFFSSMLIEGLKGSRMVVKWIFFGVLLASVIRAFVPVEHFATYFGPSLLGLSLTVLAATIIEVCSEGSTPIAADLLNQAKAPGNSFAFLMTGVSTDYTEIMVLKETTKTWKTPLFLPLLTVPQVIVVAWILNHLNV